MWNGILSPPRHTYLEIPIHGIKIRESKAFVRPNYASDWQWLKNFGKLSGNFLKGNTHNILNEGLTYNDPIPRFVWIVMYVYEFQNQC